VVALPLAVTALACGCENESTPSPDGGTGPLGDSGSEPVGDADMPMTDARTDGGEVDGGGGIEEGESTMGRLFVADSISSSVRVIDLDEGTVFESMPTTSIARIYANANATGRYAYAVQADGDVVHIFDSGILFASHEDHYHITKSAPSMLEAHLDGDQPIHFSSFMARRARRIPGMPRRSTMAQASCRSCRNDRCRHRLRSCSK
jgi:hypothetical protein